MTLGIPTVLMARTHISPKFHCNVCDLHDLSANGIYFNQTGLELEPSGDSHTSFRLINDSMVTATKDSQNERG